MKIEITILADTPDYRKDAPVIDREIDAAMEKLETSIGFHYTGTIIQIIDKEVL